MKHVYASSMTAVGVEEHTIMMELFGSDNHGSLNELLHSWLKGLDLLELYLYAKDQKRLGNLNLETMRVAIENRFKKDAHKYPEPILNLYHECKNSDWVFLPDLGV